MEVVTVCSVVTFTPTSYRRNCVLQPRHTFLCSTRVELLDGVDGHTAGENGVTSRCSLPSPQS